MIRTQIYLTEKERKFLNQMCRHTGKSQSELIRDAIDLFCQHHSTDKKIALLRSAKGIWEDRSDEDFEAIRKEMDRDSGDN